MLGFTLKPFDSMVFPLEVERDFISTIGTEKRVVPVRVVDSGLFAVTLFFALRQGISGLASMGLHRYFRIDRLGVAHQDSR